jgi:hypothetical protein
LGIDPHDPSAGVVVLAVVDDPVEAVAVLVPALDELVLESDELPHAATVAASTTSTAPTSMRTHTRRP